MLKDFYPPTAGGGKGYKGKGTGIVDKDNKPVGGSSKKDNPYFYKRKAFKWGTGLSMCADIIYYWQMWVGLLVSTEGEKAQGFAFYPGFIEMNLQEESFSRIMVLRAFIEREGNHRDRDVLEGPLREG